MQRKQRNHVSMDFKCLGSLIRMTDNVIGDFNQNILCRER